MLFKRRLMVEKQGRRRCVQTVPIVPVVVVDGGVVVVVVVVVWWGRSSSGSRRRHGAVVLRVVGGGDGGCSGGSRNTTTTSSSSDTIGSSSCSTGWGSSSWTNGLSTLKTTLVLTLQSTLETGRHAVGKRGELVDKLLTHDLRVKRRWNGVKWGWNGGEKRVKCVS